MEILPGKRLCVDFMYLFRGWRWKRPSSWASPAKESVVQYLGYFCDVRFESFLNSRIDTLSHSEEPDYILHLELVDGRRISAGFSRFQAGMKTEQSGLITTAYM